MLTDEELELHIEHCGHLMELEMDRGNRGAALDWMQAMQEAIRSRSPAQVAKMEAERGLTPEPYFLNKAEEDRAQIVKRQAA